jgi:nucleoside phosphorylase
VVANYSYAHVRTRRDQVLRVVVARTPAQGPGVAQAIASSIIADVWPRWILLVGIAGGIPSTDYSLGDVLLSQRLHDFLSLGGA